MIEKTDVFAKLAQFVSVRPEVQQICSLSARWEAPQEDEVEEGWAAFHLVTGGACMLEADLQTIRMEAGTVAIVPHGKKHVLRAVPEASGRSAALNIASRRHDAIFVKWNVEGIPETKLVCGRLRIESTYGNLLMSTIPGVIVAHASLDEDALAMGRIVELIDRELQSDRAAAMTIATSLAQSLMMMVLRRNFENESSDRGILALLTRRQTAKAVVAIVAKPTHPWTLDLLANEAGTSRATLVRMFNEAVGMAPHTFLTNLRLTQARSRLQSGTSTLSSVSLEAGYASEAAFRRAYRRLFSVSPAADQRKVVRRA